MISTPVINEDVDGGYQRGDQRLDSAINSGLIATFNLGIKGYISQEICQHPAFQLIIYPSTSSSRQRNNNCDYR